MKASETAFTNSPIAASELLPEAQKYIKDWTRNLKRIPSDSCFTFPIGSI